MTIEAKFVLQDTPDYTLANTRPVQGYHTSPCACADVAMHFRSGHQKDRTSCEDACTSLYAPSCQSVRTEYKMTHELGIKSGTKRLRLGAIEAVYDSWVCNLRSKGLHNPASPKRAAVYYTVSGRSYLSILLRWRCSLQVAITTTCKCDFRESAHEHMSRACAHQQAVQ